MDDPLQQFHDALSALTDTELAEFIGAVDTACDDSAAYPGVVEILDAILDHAAAEQQRRTVGDGR